MTRTIEELYSRDIQQERFAMLVAARVNDILAETAKPLEFPKAGGVFNSKEEEMLLFADTVARTVCAAMRREDSSE